VLDRFTRQLAEFEIQGLPVGLAALYASLRGLSTALNEAMKELNLPFISRYPIVADLGLAWVIRNIEPIRENVGDFTTKWLSLALTESGVDETFNVEETVKGLVQKLLPSKQAETEGMLPEYGYDELAGDYGMYELGAGEESSKSYGQEIVETPSEASTSEIEEKLMSINLTV